MKTLSTCVALLFAVPLAFVTPGGAAAATAPVDEFPEAWFWRQGGAEAAHRAMVGKPPPPLSLTRWRGDDAAIAAIAGKDGKGDIWANLHGRVVVVDFWATWCGPCMAAIPKNVEMVKQHAADGLVLIGVHDAARGAGDIPAAAVNNNINYPVAVDDGGGSRPRLAVGIVPVAAMLDLKAMAAALGAKRAVMADVKEAERVTGYVVGGISPVGQRKALPTVLDAGATAFPTVYVSAGRRGLEIELSPADLVRVTGAVTAPVATA